MDLMELHREHIGPDEKIVTEEMLISPLRFGGAIKRKGNDFWEVQFNDSLCRVKEDAVGLMKEFRRCTDEM